MGYRGRSAAGALGGEMRKFGVGGLECTIVGRDGAGELCCGSRLVGKRVDWEVEVCRTWW